MEGTKDVIAMALDFIFSCLALCHKGDTVSNHRHGLSAGVPRAFADPEARSEQWRSALGSLHVGADAPDRFAVPQDQLAGANPSFSALNPPTGPAVSNRPVSPIPGGSANPQDVDALFETWNGNPFIAAF